MIKLLPVIKTYVDASNAHDVQSILSCFSENAVVRDEGETLHGREAIEDWITRTIEKYKFKFKPVSGMENSAGGLPARTASACSNCARCTPSPA